MRITNQMMTNSMLGHINGNKLNMSRLESQYSSGKKIQKPSDDPIIAVRALKIRSNLTELSQYVEKNIPDAESWMEVTESAMDNINDIIKKMNTYCVQGASDTLTAKDRTNILQNIIQLNQQIYQEGNSQYAGRYVFTGYKTDTSLIHTEAESYMKNVTVEAVKTDGTDSLDGSRVIELKDKEKNLSVVSKITIDNGQSKRVINMSSTEFGKLNPVKPDEVYFIEDKQQLVLGSAVNNAMVDTSKIHIEAEKYQGYTITEKFSGEDIGIYSTIKVPPKTNGQYPPPSTVESNRLQLSYDNIHVTKLEKADGGVELKSSVKEIQYSTDGVTYTKKNVTTVMSLDPGAYEPAKGEVYLLADTGELIFGKDIAKEVKDAKDISITYDRSQFAASDLRPEHFFNCTFTGADGTKTAYTAENQDITYEVNFGQVLKVNTEAKDAFGHEINRLVADVTTAVNRVADLEAQIKDINNQLTNTNISANDKADLNAKLEQLNTALILSKSAMQKSFAGAITATNKFQDKVNVAVADLGARANRLELTKSRLEDQQVELEDLKSNNEDVDLVETVIRYKSAESLYTSSLQAAASVIKTNLLNFL